MDKRNGVAAIILIGIGTAYGILTAGLPDRTLPDTPDPAFMPWIVTVLLVGLSLILLVRSFAVSRPAGNDAETAGSNAQPIAFLIGIFGYIVALPVLGFVLASIPFVAIAMWLFGERRVSWLAIGSFGTPILLFIVFRHGFNIILPRGLLPAVFG